ncbi:hypothetical protein D9611_010748 [Ephemerocybe angulata]|uniref:Uncharacterized protein n=1 Tax=Ephemerocybe angulata TaxID=980116 RepID=A0A8H5BC34_9AGAR|nr:hypothetical protein D9611_010748 [Tulosesus angulatus]
MRFISSSALTILSTIVLSVSVHAAPMPGVDNSPSLLASREPASHHTATLHQYTARDFSDVDLVLELIERGNPVDWVTTKVMRVVDKIIPPKFPSYDYQVKHGLLPKITPVQHAPAPKPQPPKVIKGCENFKPIEYPGFVNNKYCPGQPDWWDVSRFGPMKFKKDIPGCVPTTMTCWK